MKYGIKKFLRIILKFDCFKDLDALYPNIRKEGIYEYFKIIA